LPGLPDVWAKAWRADGLTAEPPGWVLVWDYYPGQAWRGGFAGLVSGSDAGGSELECDFFLVKADSLPEITVTLPELKPALASLVAQSPGWSGQFQFLVTGESGRAYQVEASTNLLGWIPLGTVVPSNGVAQYQDAEATNFSRRFYRAHLLP
jgi:hypothetical protein